MFRPVRTLPYPLCLSTPPSAWRRPSCTLRRIPVPLPLDQPKTSPPFSTMNSESLQSASQVDQLWIEAPERSSKSTQSPSNSLNISISLQSLETKSRSLKQLLMMMEEYVHLIILQVHRLDDSRLVSLSLALEEIFKMSKNHSDLSSLLTADINSVRQMLNPASPSASAPSNGTSSKTGDI